MESQTLRKRRIRARPHLSTMPYHRGTRHCAEVSFFILVLYCTISVLETLEPCKVHTTQKQTKLDGCKSYRDSSDSDFQGIFSADITAGLASGNVPEGNFDNVCPNSNLFCFPSTLPGYFSPQHSVGSMVGMDSDVALSVASNQLTSNLSWSSDQGTFELSGGNRLLCSLNYQENNLDIPCDLNRNGKENRVSFCSGPLLDLKARSSNFKEKTATTHVNFLDGLSSPHVEVNPPLLDWGQKYLYFPSVALITVANTHSDNILSVYEPYSTNSQFYPCNFSEMSLAPGEVVSICFVFLPTWLGSTSAQLVLQTSAGGFLVQAKGFAIESPYGIQPLVGLDISSTGRLRKKLSLFNPFNEALYVEEVTGWISVSSVNTSRMTTATCSIIHGDDSSDLSLLTAKEWLDVRTGEAGLPVIGMKPYRNWEVGPRETETIMELDFSYQSEGKIFGALCMQLLRSKDNVDAIMVPLEAELERNSAFDDLENLVSVSIDILMPCDSTGTVVAALTVTNNAPHLLSVVSVGEVGERMKQFHVKYVEGLLLFPSSITQVGVVTYAPLAIEFEDKSTRTPKLSLDCKLLILINDSRNPQIEVPCKDVVSMCSRHNLDSSVGYRKNAEEVEYASGSVRSLGNVVQPLSEIKAMSTTEADELILRHWKSQATVGGISILDGPELLFSMVQVGSYSSQWITVKNPSQHPVLMQLILNSGEIISECKDPDRLLQPSSSSSLVGNKSTAPTRYGFSTAEGAVTEAYVHPHGKTSLGPIFFQPANRCEWRSSAIIRNNLSGVEWLPLRGFGGSLSLVLLEESLPVQSLEFKLKMPTSLNFSSAEMLYHMKEKTHVCSAPLSKELLAKNTGDLPVEVRRIKVSGTECGLDGFVVHNCKGFSLEPGESLKLQLSYHSDFTAATIQRDLELALAAGILVIPMKASLPTYMLSTCKKSMFWLRVKKSMVVILFICSILFLALIVFHPHGIIFGSQGSSLKRGQNSVTSVSNAGKSSKSHKSQKLSKFVTSSKMNGLPRSGGEDELMLLESAGNSYGQAVSLGQEQGLCVQEVIYATEYQKRSDCISESEKEVKLPSSSKSNFTAVESCNSQEPSEAGNLTVKIGKEKGRRRRKRKGSSTVASGVFEASSSHSGNSTPSSPLSPVTSLPPKRLWPFSPDAIQSAQARNPFAHMTDPQHEKGTSSKFVPKAKGSDLGASMKSGSSWAYSTEENSTISRKMASNPVLLPSATFPRASKPVFPVVSRPFSVSKSAIAPDARAPGSKLAERKTVKTEAKSGSDEEKFTYDIWGNHLFGLPLTTSAEASPMPALANLDNSHSFFLRGPQTLIANSQSVSHSDPEG